MEFFFHFALFGMKLIQLRVTLFDNLVLSLFTQNSRQNLRTKSTTSLKFTLFLIVLVYTVTLT